jgi:cell division protein FtsQ
MGNSQLTRSDLLSVFGGDIGHNLFFVPLAKRRAALEQIPWVESATVMRLLPNQLRVAVKERTPIAFVEVHGRIELADVDGVILSMTPRDMAAQHYSFPVVTGIRPADPLPERSLRMHLYQRFVSELDASGQRLSGQLSEIDLSDPEDVRARVPGNGSDMLLYIGQEDFLSRWRNYQDHIGQWRQQYPQLASVDLRYEHQVVLKMAGDPDIDPAQNSAPAPAVRKASSAARPAHPAHPGEIARRHAPSRARHAHEKHSARHPARRSA